MRGWERAGRRELQGTASAGSSILQCFVGYGMHGDSCSARLGGGMPQGDAVNACKTVWRRLGKRLRIWHRLAVVNPLAIVETSLLHAKRCAPSDAIFREYAMQFE